MPLLESTAPPATGEVSIAPFDRDGKPLSDPFRVFAQPEIVKQATLANKAIRKTYEDTGEIILGPNLVVNLGRQTIAYLLGGRDYNSVIPNNSWIVTQCSWGTGEVAPRFTDSSLSPQAVAGQTSGGENEIYYDGVNRKKNLTGVDWPLPFIVRFEATLGADEAVGYLIREFGLWTGNGVLFARKVFPAISKGSDFGIAFLHRVRA